jgi:hypothetical protein
MPKKEKCITPMIIPDVKLSPLRSRLHEKLSPSKNKKKMAPKVQKSPRVFKSPKWFTSPAKVAKLEEDMALRELYRRDPNMTEEGIEKIIADHRN